MRDLLTDDEIVELTGYKKHRSKQLQWFNKYSIPAFKAADGCLRVSWRAVDKALGAREPDEQPEVPEFKLNLDEIA